MPTTEKTLRDLRAAMKRAKDQAARERDVTRGPLEQAFIEGKAEGIRVAQRLVEMLCQ